MRGVGGVDFRIYVKDKEEEVLKEKEVNGFYYCFVFCCYYGLFYFFFWVVIRIIEFFKDF